MARTISTPHELVPRLLRLNACQLKQISVSCGLSSSGTKTTLAANLATLYNTIALGEKDPPQCIVSIDLGYRNFAFARLTADYRLIEWSRVALGLPDQYNPVLYSRTLREFVHTTFLSHPRETLFLIERQRHRTGGCASLAESVLKVAFVEILLHCLLLGQTRSVLPGTVAKYFGLPIGAAKKKAASNLVCSWLEGLPNRSKLVVDSPNRSKLVVDSPNRSKLVVDLPNRSKLVVDSPDLIEKFRQEKKRDDLADCLLQGVAYFDWRNNCMDFFNRLAQKS